MKRSILLLVVFAFFSCKHGQHKFNPEAKKLNDSAVNLIMGPPVMSRGDSTLIRLNTPAKDSDIKLQNESVNIKPPVIDEDDKYKKAIELLNKATQIDSNYFIAYWNKSAFENHLKRYKDALATGKQMIRLKPNDTTIRYLVGKTYYKTGDTIQAKVYYQDYLTYCNKTLDTMSIKNRHYKDVALEKGIVLLLLDQQQKGHEIFKKLYQNADNEDKDMYSLYMRVTKADLIEGKELSMTVGNKIISISL
jgi:tetratricopeptide (TPR) repeat protein